MMRQDHPSAPTRDLQHKKRNDRNSRKSPTNTRKNLISAVILRYACPVENTTPPALVKAIDGNGYITCSQAILSPKSLEFGVRVRQHIDGLAHQEHGAGIRTAADGDPSHHGCHNISERYNFLLEILARDLESFGEFIREVLQLLPGLKRSIRVFYANR